MISKKLRVIAAVALGFFIWTSAGVFSFAHAAQAVVKQEKAKAPLMEKTERAEERFGKATEEIGAVLADPKKDIEAKKQALRVKKGEIEALDVEIKKEFAATEQKLKAAKLPEEILQRHYKFVKHYEDNLAELKGNIDAVEKAKDDKESQAGIDKTKKHLERVKAPSRHQPLDPNNLPHRQPKVKKREPRLKKEEFERDFGKGKRAGLQKPIMVASVGSLAGMLAQSSATIANLPTAADLAETVEVQFTPEIQAKALELGNNPVKIYEWVRNNIEFVPTYGSIQGAQMTLETKQGNAFDTASLLIALLRASGIHARYVYGTIELPIDKVMNWAGGFTDPMAALDFMNSGGIPTKGLTQGSSITYARLEHVWVDAYINYIPSRGAKHQQGKGDTWIPLDPSYKQYTYTQGIDIKSAVPFDAQSFMDQIKSTATIDETTGSVTNVNSLLTQQTMQDYQTRGQSYIQQNYPNATVGDVLGKKDIVKQEFPYLLGTLPYRTAIKGAEYAVIPDTLRHTLTFNVMKDSFDTAPIALTKSLPELAGKKITLSYSPATSQDEAVINSYLPQPHADGTPIQSSEFPASFPAYLISVKPELQIEGQVVATGAAVNLGAIETFTMDFASPWIPSDRVNNTITAGTYHAIALDLGRISTEQAQALKSRLENTKAKLEAKNFDGLTKDELIGDLLYTTALMYHAELGLMKQIAARTGKVACATWPSETIFKTDLAVASLFGIARSVSAGGLAMDADKLATVSTALDGDQQKKINFLLRTGMASSALEHSVPEQLFSTPENPVVGVSAVKALKLANDQGIPIYTVNQANISTVMPQLQIDQYVKADIQNAVNAGKVVTVSKTNINFNGWSGCGYIIIDPTSGAGAYMIGGGLSGSVFWYNVWTVMWALAWIAAAAGALAGAALAVIFAYAPAAVLAEVATMLPTFTAILTTISGLLNNLPRYYERLGEMYFDLTMDATEYLARAPIIEESLTTIYEVYTAGPTSGLPSVMDYNIYMMFLVFVGFKNAIMKISHLYIMRKYTQFAGNIVTYDI